MNVGKTLFAQIMEFVPWTSFTRIVTKYSGNAGGRRLSCAEQFHTMAFAQLTWRESLRDIEVCLHANHTKLYAMGFRQPVHRSTLADANEKRGWRIWADLAAVLIRRARKLYCNGDFGLELSNTVYALDSTTIDLCLIPTMAKKFPVHPKHRERLCRECDKHYPPDSPNCGNGSERTQHAVELYVEDWPDWSLDSAVELAKTTGH